MQQLARQEADFNDDFARLFGKRANKDAPPPPKEVMTPTQEKATGNKKSYPRLSRVSEVQPEEVSSGMGVFSKICLMTGFIAAIAFEDVYCAGEASVAKQALLQLSENDVVADFYRKIQNQFKPK